MKLNIDRLFDFMRERDDATFDYMKSSKDFFKNYGYGASFDEPRFPQEKHIVYAYHNSSSTKDVVDGIMEVLDLNRDQIERLEAANRAVKRWYEKETEWQRCLPSHLIERLEAYIVN